MEGTILLQNTSPLVFWGQCVSSLTQALPFMVFFVSILTINDHCG